MRIAETIDAFYGESGAKDGVSRSYKQAVEDLDAETVKALDGPYRCVPLELYDYAFDEEERVFDQGLINEIERDMNFKGGKRRDYTRGFEGAAEGRVEVEGGSMLMDFIYRTTVLEPINRFCAYFPDINECKSAGTRCVSDWQCVDERQALRSAITRCSTTTPCAAKSSGLSRNPTRTRRSCQGQRRRLKW